MTSDLGFGKGMRTLQEDEVDDFVKSLLSLDDHVHFILHQQQDQDKEDQEAILMAAQQRKENAEASKKISDFLMDDNYDESHIEEHRVIQYMAELEKEIHHQTKTSSSSCSSSSSKRKIHHWTKEEHVVFLRGVKKWGWGNWKEISETFLPGRTQYQLASHAQKFMMHHGQEKPAAKKRRRSSIYDIVDVPTKP